MLETGDNITQLESLLIYKYSDHIVLLDTKTGELVTIEFSDIKQTQLESLLIYKYSDHMVLLDTETGELVTIEFSDIKQLSNILKTFEFENQSEINDK